MEKYQQEYDRESMKMAMLKHEETFRYQVHELHRLYQIQKVLMNDMKTEHEKQNLPSNWERSSKSRPSETLELELPEEKINGGGGGDGIIKAEEGDLELTLATGSRMRKKDEASSSFSWSSAESTQLSRFLRQSKRAFAADEQLSQTRMNRTPWPLHSLGLNMT